MLLLRQEMYALENTKSIYIEGMKEQYAMNIIGSHDKNLITLSKQFQKDISYRDNTFYVKDCDNEQLDIIKKVLLSLLVLAQHDKTINEQDVIYISRLLHKDKTIDIEQINSEVVGRTLTGKAIVPKTLGQYAFVKEMDNASIVFAIGPAGTGKTFLAVSKAVSALKKGDVKRIVLTRPAVEAGESLGFLPGDLKEKVDPYLTPLYDALHNMLGNEQTDKLIEKGTIEIAPLAYMRGRTLNDAYVILDEAQNTTASQMKMFLTRLGFGSHMVITGDITQIDLRQNQTSGLVEATKILQGVDEIKVIELDAEDVVRNPIVQKIIERYSQYETKK